MYSEPISEPQEWLAKAQEHGVHSPRYFDEIVRFTPGDEQTSLWRCTNPESRQLPSEDISQDLRLTYHLTVVILTNFDEVS
jgi:hypothetical protein